MTNILEIKNLTVSVDGKEVIKNLNLTLEAGKVHALMGPNGSGKSSLASTIMGHPKYKIEKGQILFKGEDITNIPPDERSRKGVFLSFQYPKSISGVTVSSFLRTALKARSKEKIRPLEFQKILDEKAAKLNNRSKVSYKKFKRRI